MKTDDINRWYLTPAIVFPWSIVLSLLVALGIIAFPIANFELSLSRQAVDIPQGGEAMLLLIIQSQHGYEKKVALSPETDHPEIKLALSRSTVKGGGYSRLRIHAGKSAQISAKKIKIRAVGEDGKSRMTELLVNVKPADWNIQDQVQQDFVLLRDEAWKESVNIIPYDDLEYANLFGDISDTLFYGYNAPFQIEGSKGDASWESALEVHQKRYQSAVRSKYLFFDADGLARAVAFWTDLQSRMKIDLKGVIEARLLDAADEGEQPIFFMWKNTATVDILYPEPFLLNGRPQLVFQMVGNDPIDALLRRNFDEKWEQARVVNILN